MKRTSLDGLPETLQTVESPHPEFWWRCRKEIEDSTTPLVFISGYTVLLIIFKWENRYQQALANNAAQPESKNWMELHCLQPGWQFTKRTFKALKTSSARCENRKSSRIQQWVVHTRQLDFEGERESQVLLQTIGLIKTFLKSSTGSALSAQIEGEVHGSYSRQRSFIEDWFLIIDWNDVFNAGNCIYSDISKPVSWR